MLNEKESNRPIELQDIIDFTRRVGVETVQDLLVREAELLTYNIPLIPSQWESYDNFNDVNAHDWKCIKFYDNEGNVSSEVEDIPSNSGGIYAYVIKPDTLPIINCSYIMYIGRAHNNGNNINLKKRVYHYINEADDLYKGRISIRNLFNIYKKYLYVMYIQLNDNQEIDKMEKELITAIVPPINSHLVQPSLSAARNMF